MRSRSFKEHFKVVVSYFVDLDPKKFEESRKTPADKNIDLRFTLNGVTKDFTAEELAEKLGFTQTTQA